jgi:hypothetical protein
MEKDEKWQGCARGDWRNAKDRVAVAFETE